MVRQYGLEPLNQLTNEAIGKWLAEQHDESITRGAETNAGPKDLYVVGYDKTREMLGSVSGTLSVRIFLRDSSDEPFREMGSMEMAEILADQGTMPSPPPVQAATVPARKKRVPVIQVGKPRRKKAAARAKKRSGRRT